MKASRDGGRNVRAGMKRSGVCILFEAGFFFGEGDLFCAKQLCDRRGENGDSAVALLLEHGKSPFDEVAGTVGAMSSAASTIGRRAPASLRSSIKVRVSGVSVRSS